jgi:hypothetical protein
MLNWWEISMLFRPRPLGHGPLRPTIARDEEIDLMDRPHSSSVDTARRRSPYSTISSPLLLGPFFPLSLNILNANPFGDPPSYIKMADLADLADLSVVRSCQHRR